MILLVVAVAVAQDIPAPVQAWSDGMAEAYAHYASVEPAWELVSDVFPPCPTPGEPIPTAPRSSMSEVHRAAWKAAPAKAHASCAALRPEGWRLQLRLSPHDQRIFSPAVVRVSQVVGTSAEHTLTELVDRGIWAARGFQALIPAGPYLVELNVPCGASTVFAYDLADAVQAAAAAQPSPKSAPPATIAVSGCGRMAFEMVPYSTVLEDGQRLREAWGFNFPERRVRERQVRAHEAAE